MGSRRKAEKFALFGGYILSIFFNNLPGNTAGDLPGRQENSRVGDCWRKRMLQAKIEGALMYGEASAWSCEAGQVEEGEVDVKMWWEGRIGWSEVRSYGDGKREGAR